MQESKSLKDINGAFKNEQMVQKLFQKLRKVFYLDHVRYSNYWDNGKILMILLPLEEVIFLITYAEKPCEENKFVIKSLSLPMRKTYSEGGFTLGITF